ncbi:sialin-like [Amphiura filiformis]|uniref:sialin-like n=1 Tax=Amphiura filiformis TaxID=82378 RepID=UPI003B20DC15
MTDNNQTEEAPLLSASRGDPNIDVPKIPGCIATRHVFAIFAFFGFVNVYMMRVNLSVALVAMVEYTPNFNLTPTNHNDTCPPRGDTNSSDHSKSTAATYSWDEDTQNQILGAFYYGYILTQIPGGWLAGRFGGKWIFGLGILSTSILTLLTPLAAGAGVGWFITLRILEGIGEGVTFPAIYAMIAHWAPPLEHTKLINISTSGSMFGTIFAYPIAGVLCDSNFLEGWPSVFYLSGALGILWFIFWMLFIHDTPEKHPRISQEEREYIQKSKGSTKVTTLYVPLLAMLTSGPVWAIIICNFAYNWGGYTLITNLPNYLKNILMFDVSQSGFLSGLPYVFLFVVSVIGGFLADFLRKSGILSTNKTRKIFNSIGLILSGFGVVMVGYVGCDTVLAMLYLCLASVGQGLVQSGHSVNHLDIAPRYAGLLMGFSNSAGTAAGFLAPITVGVLTEDNNTIGQWQIVFWISFGFFMLGFIVFLLLGSGDVQYWALDDYVPTIVEDYETSTTQGVDDYSINPDMPSYFSKLRH